MVNRFTLPGARTHYTRDRTYDSKHIKLDLAFDLDRGRVHGWAYNTVAAINDGLRHIEFDQVGLYIESVSVEGKPCSFYTTDGKLHVDLGRTLREGEEVTVEIKYWAEPRKGLYFIKPDAAYPQRPVQVWSQGEDEDNRFWFPCFDSPNDRITSELIARVPPGYVAISNGRLAEVFRDDERGLVAYHWVQEIPHVSYLISVVVGRFSELRDEWDGIPVLYYVPEGREEDGWRTFKRTPQMIRFYSERLDYRYPYPKYAQVAVGEFIFGGMENTSATTLTDRALLDERAALDYDSDSLLAHELAHQWFGDLITCKHWSHAWLNEGFATYFENLWVEYSKGQDEFIRAILEDQEAYFKELAERYSRPIVTRQYESPAELFDRHLYQKAGLVLHTLRFYLGEELFWKGIRHYVKKYALQSVDTDDFRKALEEATGRSLEEFFEQWFYRAGHPEFKVRYSWDEQTRMVTLAVEQKVQEDGTVYNIPVEVALVTSSGRRTHRVTCSERVNVFSFPLEERPLTVTFDPDEWVLKSIDFEKPIQMWLYDLEHGRVGERMRAARALAKTYDPRAVPALQRAVLSDPFWGVQGEAALALGQIGTEQALKALLECTEIANPKARRMVMQALGEFRDERAADALAAKLEHDPSYFVEAEAARSLGKTKSKKAFDRLRNALAKDSFQEVIRVAVFEGYTHLGDRAAIPIAMEWSSYGRPREVRAAAIRCLGRLGEANLEVLEHITGLLKDPQYVVRMAAAEALKMLRDERALPHLEGQLARELDGRVRRRIREAIAAIREGAKAELQQLREEIEKIRAENRELRSALSRLEAQLSSRQT